MGIEILESRIAPAAVFHYTDQDGDRVTVKTSKGTNADLASICGVSNGHLNVINFAQNSTIATEFAGTDVKITDGGHNRVDVGVIVAYGGTAQTNIALGNVSVTGTLGSITVGTGSGTALTSLTVKGLNGNPSTYASHVYGSVDTISVSGAIDGKIIVDDDIGTLKAGKILGRSLTNTGYVAADNITTLNVKNGIIGGSGTSTGQLIVSNEITTAKIGQLIGGNGDYSARLQAKTIGTLTVKGDIKGGLGTASAEIYTPSGSFQEIKVKGSVLGGPGTQSARIIQTGSSAADGSVFIGGSLIAGGGNGSASVNLQGSLDALTINGKMDGGGQAGGNFAGAVIAKALSGANVIVHAGMKNNAIIWIGSPAPGTPYYHVDEIPA